MPQRFFLKIMFLPYLALGGDTFIPLLFLDQLLSADFFSNFFGAENLHQSGYFDTLPSTLNLMKVGPEGPTISLGSL